MRESIGGTWILSIVMTFLMLFTAYLAVSVNYAKAFKIKNNIISKIETLDLGEFSSEFHVRSKTFEDDVVAYLISQVYLVRGDCSKTLDKNFQGFNFVKGFNCDAASADLCSVCVYNKEANSLDNYNAQASGKKKYYYTVVDFFKFDLPLLGDFLTFNVKGTSKAV